jgi:hypothetical protein
VGHQVPMVLMELTEHQERMVLRVLMERLAPMVLPAQTEHQELMVLVVVRVSLDHL